MSKLTIYQASAGSGKTFSLALAYFRLLFRSPREYRNILAVTFTNKATEEMKSRIINELHKLAEGEEGSYGEILKKELGIDDQTLRYKAQELRSLLLHDYGHISVTTIDRFFQRIVKSFTRELGIYPGYNVELDSDYVLTKSIEKLVAGIQQDPMLGKWVGELMNASIEEGKSWNIKGKIAGLGSELFKENYMLLDREALLKFNDKESLKEYRVFLSDVVHSFEDVQREIGLRGIGIIQQSGLDITDFKNGKRGVVNHFFKLAADKFEFPNRTTQQAIDQVGNWYTKTSPSDIQIRIEEIFPDLNRLLKHSLALFEEKYRHYLSARHILGNLYQLGILSDLYRQIREYSEENGVMLLSDTTRLLNLLVENNESPFLYEKSGNYYKHIMIDEFQDTSSMQWRNFRPLISNSLSQGYQVIIVGDVKQSIYRWRNGDWTLLAGKVQDEFLHFGIQPVVLENNWRSGKNIVTFNNLFFREASSFLYTLFQSENRKSEDSETEELAVPYEVLEQHARSDKDGYIHVKFSGTAKENTVILDEIVKTIKDITGRGGRLKDTVVLVRDGKEGALVANYLMEYNKNAFEPIPFISNDSLFLRASVYVRFIVALLRYMTEPYDQVNKANILYLYHRYIKPGADSDDIPRDFSDLQNLPIGDFSLFGIVEKIIGHFHLGENRAEIAYLIAFQDIVFDFENNHSNSIVLFLEWWDKEQNKQVLNTSENTDAVRIITIHKSKGLEFNYVILPFCSWELDATRPLRRLWCDIKEDKFNYLESIPLNYSSKLEETLFCDSYYEEHLKAYVDNLNLLYVAFTRAKDELYIYPYMPEVTKKGEIKKDIPSLIRQVMSEIREKPDLKFTNESEYELSIGSKVNVLCDSKEPDPVLALGHYTVSGGADSVVIKYNHEVYTGEKQAVDEGKLLHEIFKSIRYKEDVENAVEDVFLKGLILKDKRASFVDRIRSYLNDPLVEGWFGRDYTILNERDILLPSGKRIRPDRVMIKGDETIVIDYKFGQTEDKSYDFQIRSYKNALTKMGYKNVKTYIWYVVSGKIVEG